MADALTAEARLARVLELIPRAARAGGAPIEELAAELEITPRELLSDLEEVYTREYYHPAGSADGVQVTIGTDQVEVWTTGEFRRPPRFRPGEALALGLGLRILAAESPDAVRPELVALAQRLESGLAGGSPAELLEAIAVNPGDEPPEQIRAVLHQAAREHRRCEIVYRRSGAVEPAARLVDPYVFMAANGVWYLVGHCHRSGSVRVFRTDRILSAELRPEIFSIPDGFDPRSYLREGRVYHADAEVEVHVRYSARIARWILEEGPAEARADGSVVVRYQVADPAWLVRHVLRHGADAEVLDPPEMRARVRDAAARMVG
jgi:proteasome accessory factor C